MAEIRSDKPNRESILQLIDAMENSRFVPFFSRAEAEAGFQACCIEYAAGRYAQNKPSKIGQWGDLINNTRAPIAYNMDYLKSEYCDDAEERDAAIIDTKTAWKKSKFIEDWVYYQLQDPAAKQRLLDSVVTKPTDTPHQFRDLDLIIPPPLQPRLTRE